MRRPIAGCLSGLVTNCIAASFGIDSFNCRQLQQLMSSQGAMIAAVLHLGMFQSSHFMDPKIFGTQNYAPTRTYCVASQPGKFCRGHWRTVWGPFAAFQGTTIANSTTCNILSASIRLPSLHEGGWLESLWRSG